MHLVSQGKSEAAFGPVRDGFALAAPLRNEPFLISELVRIAFAAIALRSLECALPEENFDDELGFHDRDLRLYLEITARFADAMTNSFPKAYQESVALSQELTNRFSSGLARFAVLSKGTLPPMVKATGKEAALVTSLRCARTAVAIERYRLAHDGKLPDDLQRLVPKYLAEVPRDGAKGEPIQFEQIEGGYQLSSPPAAKLLDNKTSTVFPVVRWKFEGTNRSSG